MRILPGSRVAYTVQFLYYIGEAPTGDLCHKRGTVSSLRRLCKEVTLAVVKWDDDEEYTVNVTNLTLIGRNHYYSNCGIGFVDGFFAKEPRKKKRR